MLVLHFKVDYRLKILKGISVESMKCLNEDMQKKREEKNAVLSVHPHAGMDAQITTLAKLRMLNIKCEFLCTQC